VINQIKKYRRHGMWSGSKVNAKKAPLAAWKQITRPKQEGGLGILKLKAHNDALLMKSLYKMYNKLDILWVKLI
jgi:hypothetical protein